MEETNKKIVKDYKRKEIRKWMMEIKGGDFPKWYNGLTDLEKEIYSEEFQKLQEKNEKDFSR